MRVLIFIFSLLFAAEFHFDVYKKGNSNNTLLVIGGIHGNEPGGYYAASFLARYYKVKKGSLWVVPNLNFDSILEFKRGKYGDMNRKFAYISKKDRDYEIVKDIKKLILSKNVKMIINLHDGHGFYRKSWQNSIFNPAAWGQTCIIDQERIDSEFGNLGEIARRVAKNLNSSLTQNFHTFNVKNTHTKFKDEQMRLSLTYFAISHKKAAFAIETSKNIKDLATKVFYQLRAIEEFMKIMGIEYNRDFNLSIKGIRNLLKKEEFVIIDNSILPLKSLRKTIKFFPMSKNPKVVTDNPLVVLVKRKNYYLLKEAYNTSVIYPEYVKVRAIKSVKVEVDGKILDVKIPSVIEVKRYFKVLSSFRVNVIGFNGKNDSFKKISKIPKRFSVDKNGKIFRVEIYDKEYLGMFLVRFN